MKKWQETYIRYYVLYPPGNVTWSKRVIIVKKLGYRKIRATVDIDPYIHPWDYNWWGTVERSF